MFIDARSIDVAKMSIASVDASILVVIPATFDVIFDECTAIADDDGSASSEDVAHCRSRMETWRDRVPRECPICRQTRCGNDDRA